MAREATYQELKERVRVLEEAESLRQWEESELQEIFSMSLDMICIANLNTTKLVKVNPAFSEILGFTEEELLGKQFLDLVHPDEIDSTQSIIAERLALNFDVLNFEPRQ